LQETTIEFVGTGAVGQEKDYTTTVNAFNPYSPNALPMPITLYNNRASTPTVIRVELRDIFENVTCSTYQTTNLQYTCINSNNARASEDASYDMNDRIG